MKNDQTPFTNDDFIFYNIDRFFNKNNRSKFQLIALMDAKEKARIDCVTKNAFVQSIIPFDDKQFCDVTTTDMILEELDANLGINTSNSIHLTRIDDCEFELAIARDRCRLLKLCCPLYEDCAMQDGESDISKRYTVMVSEASTIQSDCESVMMNTLKSLQSTLFPSKRLTN
ncbi:hypothetical protein AB6A40_009094 [Gnathostoma spinigerum]|uniref:Uncharacterized protein n=1 Tax=Gnathostoma spinigerum TaxID=75299 RepID=A0ABD6EQY9_9BILA